MKSKNGTMSAAERRHIGRVKQLPCSVCGVSGPSDAHHIEQGLHYVTVALCKDCHQGSQMGWHGQKTMWRIKKMTELDALNETVKRLTGAPVESIEESYL